MYQILQVVSNIWLTKWVAHPEANSPKMRYYFLGIYTAIGMVQGIIYGNLKLGQLLL